MAAPKTKQKGASKVKKKKWLPVSAPKMFNEMFLGETHVQEPIQAKGKYLSVNLMTITRDIKKQNTNLTFKIVDVIGDKAVTKLVKYTVIPSSVKRLVRRRRDRIDDSFQVAMKDSTKVRVKPLIITRTNTNNQIRSAIRTKVSNFLIKTSQANTYDSFVEKVIQGKLQREIRDLLSKVSPVRTCEIRELSIETEKRAKRSKKKELVEEPVVEPEEVIEDNEIVVPEEKESESSTEETKESTDEVKEKN